MAAGVRGRGGAGRAAGEPDRRRAAGARRPDRAGRGGARAAALRQPDHQRHSRRSRAARRAGGAPAWTACSSRCRTSTRTAPRGSRGATISKASWRSRPPVRALGLPLTLNVVLHRGNIARVPRVRRAGRADRRRAAGAREHAVPRLGAREPRRAAARARATSSGRAPSPRPPPSGCAARSRSCSCAPTTTRIARAPAWTAGRGATSSSRPTAWCCRATRRAASPGSPSRTVRARPLAAIWSDSPALRAYPRRGLDAGAVPDLRRAAHGLRRLPLPGVRAARRRGRDRSRLRALAPPRHRRARRAPTPTQPPAAAAPPPIRLRRMRTPA